MESLFPFLPFIIIERKLPEAMMESITHFLINLLIILVSLLFFQGFVIKNHLKRTHLEFYMFLTLTISVSLCMMFPLTLPGGIPFDLRFIPLVLGCLYASRYTGVWLVALIVVLRIAIHGFENSWFAIGNAIIFSCICFTIREKFKQYSLAQKVTLQVSLFIGMSIWVLTGSKLLFQSPITVSFTFAYTGIHAAGIGLAIFMAEHIKNQHLLLLRLIRSEKAEVASHLASSISHEVRNPLTASRGFLQLLSESSDIPEKEKAYIDLAISEIDSADHIIRDYLTFAKPTAEKIEILEMNKEIQQAIQIVEPMAKQFKVEIHSQLDSAFITGSSGLLQQVLVNIMRNGIEAMSTGGTLTVHSVREQTSLLISVKDDGIGMSQQQINRLGEPYFSTKDLKGTGLGMMVVYRIVESMKGNIHIDSKKGIGTTIFIRLPYMTDAEERKIS